MGIPKTMSYCTSFGTFWVLVYKPNTHQKCYKKIGYFLGWECLLFVYVLDPYSRHVNKNLQIVEKNLANLIPCRTWNQWNDGSSIVLQFLGSNRLHWRYYHCLVVRGTRTHVHLFIQWKEIGLILKELKI